MERTNNRYQYYGAKGIKCLLSLADVKFLIERDSADEMKKPQIHRFDKTQDYCVQNCGFIEASEHSRITHTGAKRSLISRIKMSNSGGTLFGEKHGMSKLKRRQVRIIRNTDIPAIKLSEKFNISRQTIYAIRSGRLWQK